MSVIQIIQLCVLILTEGKKLVDFAISIYDAIEKRVHAGEKLSSKAKAEAFDLQLALATGATLSHDRIEKLREGIWRTRPENRGRSPRAIV